MGSSVAVPGLTLRPLALSQIVRRGTARLVCRKDSAVRDVGVAVRCCGEDSTKPSMEECPGQLQIWPALELSSMPLLSVMTKAHV